MAVRWEGVSLALNVEPYEVIAKTSQRLEDKPCRRKKIDVRRLVWVSLFTC